MNSIDIKQAYQSVRHYAEIVGGISKDAELIEICDFGDAYGFLLGTGDKFANLYWCIKKETRELYSYRPNMDIEKFRSRKVLQKEVLE